MAMNIDIPTIERINWKVSIDDFEAVSADCDECGGPADFEVSVGTGGHRTRIIYLCTDHLKEYKEDA